MQINAGAAVGEHELSLDNLNATIISSNFWPPIQVCISFDVIASHVLQLLGKEMILLF